MIAEVVPGIAIGSFIGATTTLTSGNNCINGIINLSGMSIKKSFGYNSYIDIMMLDQFAIPIVEYQVDDAPITPCNAATIVPILIAAANKLDELRRQGRVVLVNCAMGINRSAAVIGIYLVAHKHVPPAVAIALIEAANARRGVPALTNGSFRKLIWASATIGCRV